MNMNYDIFHRDCERISNHYDANNDTGSVTWIDQDQNVAIRALLFKVKELEERIARLEDKANQDRILG